MTITLHAEERAERGKQLQKVRAAGKTPAVFYGPKEEATPITLDSKEAEKILKEAGESTIIDLKGLGDDKEVLVQDIDYDPLSGAVRHVDFYAIERGKKLEVTTALEFHGEAPAIKKGGVLTIVLRELEIECLPRHLPQHIDVDLSSLTDIGSQLQVSELTIPEGVEVKANPDDMVAVVHEPEEEPEEEPEAPDMDAIEVEKKGKEEEGDESSPESKEEQTQ